MAEYITEQELIDAKIDAADLGEFTNEDKIVNPRYGASYKSAPMIAREYEQNGATRGFNTLAEFDAVKATIPAYTVVTISEAGANQGLNVWNGTTLTKSPYDPIEAAKLDATTKANAAQAAAITAAQADATTKANTAKSEAIVVAATDATTKANAAEANAKNYVSNNGSAKVVAVAASNINYTTSTRLLNFANTVTVITPTNRYTLATPTNVSLASNSTYRLEYNIATNTVRAVLFNAAKTESWLVLGFISVTDNGITTFDFNYTVNGAQATIGQLGQVFTATPLTININTNDLLFSTRSNGRVITGDRWFVLPSADIALPTTNGVYRVEYNPSNGLVELNISSALLKINNIIFARLVVSGGVYSLYGVDVYSINGVQASSISESSNTGVLLGTVPTDINFDFVAKTLTIEGQKVRFLRSGKTSLLTGQVLDISSNPGAWHSIVVDANNNLALRIVTAPNTTGDVVVGNIRASDQQITGIPYFSVQGKTSSGDSNLRTAKFIMPFGNVEPDYNQPELPAYSSLQAANQGDYTKFYALYDALMSAHPDYIEKTVLGTDALGNPINQYKCSTPEVDNVAELSVKPKIIILSGVHGSEQAGMYNTYFALKEIIERWREDSHLEALYWGVNFIIVPVSNPTAYNANSRFNHNNVDIARNFPAGWSTVLDNPGTAPLSEAETVILDAVMSNNRDAIYLCSHHNFGDASKYFIWNPAASYFSRDLGKNLVIGQTIRAKKRYEWMPQTNNYYIGYSDLGQPNGSEGRQAVDKYAINASSFEICASFAWESGKPAHSSAVATIGVEAFINWLLMNIKYAPQLYNTRINL